MKTVILILTEHQSPADRGRMAHALNMASDLIEAGVETRVVFAGKSVEWLPAFLAEDRAAQHPFIQHYGHRFDEVRDHVVSCNFCNRRFDTMDPVAAAGVPIHGEGKRHMGHAWMVTEGWNVVTF